MPLDTATPKAPIDALRDELRRPLRAAAVGVAAGAWTYGEALDRLIGDHLLPAIRRNPELSERFEELEEKLGNALAKRVERVQAQIDSNAALLRRRAKRMETLEPTTQTTRDSARLHGLHTVLQVALKEGVMSDRFAEVAMEMTAQSDRDRARKSVPVPARVASDSADEAARRAQASVDRSHVATAG